MPTSGEEYRKARAKEVTLPSTLTDGTHPVFVIRKPSAKALIAFTGSLNLEMSEDIEEIKGSYKEALKTKEGQQKVSEGLRELLVNCVIEPKLSLTEGEEDKLFVDDIDSEDQIALLEAILKTSGISEEDKAKRESFREPAVS